MSAGRRLSAMAVPPAAIMARFDADLSMIALEAIGTQQNLLNQSPETGPACLLIQSRHGDKPGRFPHAGDSPATGAHLRNSSQSPEAFSREAKGAAFHLTL